MNSRLLAAVVLVLAATALAGEKPPLRMAYCMEPGVCYNRPGKPRAGVAVDWAERIGKILGREIKYVDVTQAKAEEMLMRGEVDLIGGLIFRVARAKKYHYFPHVTGQWKISLYTRENAASRRRSGGTPLKFCKVIGNVRSFPITDGILAAMAQFGRKVEIREYDDVPQMEDALRRCEIDAFLADGISDGTGIECVGCDLTVPQYFVTCGTRWDLIEEVEAAMREIASDPNFVKECRLRNYPLDDGTLLPTFEELLWLEKRIADDRPVRIDISGSDPLMTGGKAGVAHVQGLLGAFVDSLERMTCLPHEMVSQERMDTAIARFSRGDAEMWFPSAHQKRITAEFAASNGWRTIRLKIPQAVCSLKVGSRKFPDPTGRIAVWKGDKVRIDGYRANGHGERLVLCDSPQDCMKALADGRADSLLCGLHSARSFIETQNLGDRVDVVKIDNAPYEADYPFYVSPKADPHVEKLVRRFVATLGRDDLVNMVLRGESDDWVPTMPVSKVLVYISALAFLALALIAGFVLYSWRKLAVAYKAEERANKSKSVFIATMSHEIRTPLNAVIGFSEFLRAKIGSEDNRREFLDGITHASNALLALINDILDLSKLEAGKDGLLGGQTDLGALVDEMKSVFGFRFSEKGLRFEISVDTGIPALDLNELRVRQIFFNLIGNAVKFTEKGGVFVAVSWSATTRNLRIIVEDTGIGISPSALEGIFRPFEQDGSVRGGKVYEGTGLGLAIVRKLAESAHGTVSVKSEVGKGSVFTVEIPNVQPCAAPAKMRRTVKLRPAVRLGAVKAVIVDDVKMNLMVLRQHLKLSGVDAANIVEFTAAKPALAALATCDPARTIVLTDMWMPGMNGQEFAAAIKAEAAYKSIPVIAITADADTGKTFDMTSFDGVVTKPVTGEKIRKLFESLSVV